MTRYIDDELRRMPAQVPGKSKQDYETPREFIDAVEQRFGSIVHDLAASRGNVCAGYYTEECDSLARDWSGVFPEGTLWLNPPFSNIAPWAAKCFEESKKRHGLILMLTPAAIGTNWFSQHIAHKAYVLALSPRMAFGDQEDPYPKDLMLTVFGYGLSGFDTWRWK
jgi:phage N-6-adenine-methyltransferase